FRHVSPGHLRFSLSDIRHGVELTDHFQVHTVELPKYSLEDAEVRTASSLSQWAFLLKMAPQLGADRLRNLLIEAPFHKAIGVMEMISRTPEQRQIYDARQKAIRDFESAIEGARLRAHEGGREEGLVEGQQVGQIRLLQRLLHDTVSDESELTSRPLKELFEMAQLLQGRLTQRGGL
ncbi:MAG TPA: PD-(D/E)XK nuclease family transposase, partial [Planctomycetaceae bacterium]|nr:PD-(D/E)XK nuclease family transposase [Planctomycetaceae bacterium]